MLSMGADAEVIRRLAAWRLRLHPNPTPPRVRRSSYAPHIFAMLFQYKSNT